MGSWEPVATPADASASQEDEAGGGGAGAEAGSGAGVFGVGARVEVLSADKWYPAVSDV